MFLTLLCVTHTIPACANRFQSEANQCTEHWNLNTICTYYNYILLVNCQPLLLNTFVSSNLIIEQDSEGILSWHWNVTGWSDKERKQFTHFPQWIQPFLFRPNGQQKGSCLLTYCPEKPQPHLQSNYATPPSTGTFTIILLHRILRLN